MTVQKSIWLLWLVFAAFAAAAGTHSDKTAMVVYGTQGNYAFVAGLVRQAIAERGLKVNNVSHIGDMLVRTGADVGDDTPVFANAEAIQFCSASLSRRMMRADPRNIFFCPYSIAVYVLPQQPAIVYVGYRRPQPSASAQSKAVLADVEKLLDGIAREATQ